MEGFPTGISAVDLQDRITLDENNFQLEWPSLPSTRFLEETAACIVVLLALAAQKETE